MDPCKEITASEYEIEYRFWNLTNGFEIDLNWSSQTCTAGFESPANCWVLHPLCQTCLSILLDKTAVLTPVGWRPSAVSRWGRPQKEDQLSMNLYPCSLQWRASQWFIAYCTSHHYPAVVRDQRQLPDADTSYLQPEKSWLGYLL